MTYLLLQTFLLLLSAYFLGAFSACLAKRMVATRQGRVALVPAALQPAVVVPADVTPLVKPRSIERVQPKIDVFPRPEPHAVPAALDVSRFERALAGPDPNEGMPRDMIVEIRPAVLESPTGPPVPFTPKPDVVEYELTDASETTPDEAPGVDEPHEVSPSQSHSSSGMAMATAAAAAAVAAARAAADAASSSYAKQAAEGLSNVERNDDVVRISYTEAIGHVPPSVTLESRPTASDDDEAFDVAGGDDLQSIRAIDADTELRLKRLGVSTFAQIAHWTGEDIDYVAAALSLGGRIEEEEWVEQAQILARGGDTYYARTRAAALSPEDEAASALEIDDATDASAAEETTGETSHFEPEAAESNVSLVDDDDVGEAREVESDDDDASAGVSEELDSEVAEGTDDAGVSESTSEQVSGQGSAAAAAAAAAAASYITHSLPPSVQPEARDEAKSVEEDEPQPQELSTSSFQKSERSVSEMAAAAAAAIAAASASVTKGLRPIEPISPLSRANPNVVMPTKLVDALRERDQQVQGGKQSKAAPGASSLASAGGGVERPAVGGDDLKRIRGIGVLIERQLNANGVTSYQQIANWSSSDIDAISAKLDFKGRIERENWVEQARILSSGGATEFSRRIDRGDGDR